MKILALAVLAAGTLWAGSAAAETWDVPCPDTARGSVEHPNGELIQAPEEGDWTATEQSSRVQSVSVEQMGSGPILVCHYRLFGGDYWLYRRPPRQVPYCTVLRQPTADNPRSGFSCTDNRR